MAITRLLEVHLKDSSEASYRGVQDTLDVTLTRPGAISMDVLIDDTDPTRVVVVETWETVDQHDAYEAWRATEEGAATALIAVLAEAPVTRKFTTLDRL
jgi:heme oxygenase (mycobilin-producing)